MSTCDNIARDAALNIVNLAAKIIDGKEPEKNEETLKRIRTLRNEIDLCIAEALFMRDVRPDSRAESDLELKGIDKVISFAEIFADEKRRESFGGIYDADLVAPFIERIRTQIDTITPRGFGSNHIEWLYPYGPSDQPHAGCQDEWMDKAGGYVKKLVCAAQKASGKTLNVMFSRGNYEPEAIKAVKKELGDDVRLYGTYDSQSLLQDRNVRLSMERCVFGDSRDYQISNNVFDVIYDRCISEESYETYDTRAASAISPITKDLKRLYRYLAPGGLLMMLVPKFCLKQKERLTASGLFKLLWQGRVPCTEYPDVDLRLLVFEKKTVILDEEKDATYEALTNLLHLEEDFDEFLAHGCKDISEQDAGPVKTMSGPEEDLLIVQISFDKSTLKIKKEKQSVRSIEPLLPLKKGQIGQIIASGRLNGIIDEGGGYKHVISGRVVKGSRRYVKRDYADRQHAREEHHNVKTNMVEINALGGDGLIRTISMEVKE